MQAPSCMWRGMPPYCCRRRHLPPPCDMHGFVVIRMQGSPSCWGNPKKMFLAGACGDSSGGSTGTNQSRQSASGPAAGAELSGRKTVPRLHYPLPIYDMPASPCYLPVCTCCTQNAVQSYQYRTVHNFLYGRRYSPPQYLQSLIILPNHRHRHHRCGFVCMAFHPQQTPL